MAKVKGRARGGSHAEDPRRASVLRDLAELQGLRLSALRARWRDLFGTEPPGYKRDRMVKRLGYRLQELAYGGLTPEASSRLEQIAEEVDGPVRKDGKVRPMRRRKADGQLTPGTRLVREWGGQQHEVTVLESGFEYAGRTFRSLSAVARAISNSHWNGWAFFGLRGTAR